MRRASILALVFCFTLTGVTWALARARDAGTTVAAARHCGTERWAVKTLSDNRARLVNFHPRRASVAGLRRKPRPQVSEGSPRLPGVEETTYRVRARLVEFV